MSVRKRSWASSSSGHREAWVVDYVDQTGKRRLKTFARKKDAEAFRARAGSEVQDGVHVADSATVTVAEAGRLWLRTCDNAGLERSTLDQYRQHLDLHIIPFIGSRRLSEITAPIVRSFQDTLRTASPPRSQAMVKRVTGSLGGILSDAQERGLVIRNAVREMSHRGAKAHGKGERRQKAKLQVGVDIPTTDEVRRIVETAEGRYRPLIITAIFTGMRASELRGLRWVDVELDGARLHVRQRADRYQAMGMPKSESSQRTIPLPPMVVNTLREWRLACPQGELGLVFPNGKGNVEALANIVTRGLAPAQIAAKVTSGDRAKYTGMHALRHWFASWCINRRTDGGLELSPKRVQALLGHSSISMTMDTYGHLFPSDDEMEALAAAEQTLMRSAHAT